MFQKRNSFTCHQCSISSGRLSRIALLSLTLFAPEIPTVSSNRVNHRGVKYSNLRLNDAFIVNTIDMSTDINNSDYVTLSKRKTTDSQTSPTTSASKSCIDKCKDYEVVIANDTNIGQLVQDYNSNKSAINCWNTDTLTMGAPLKGKTSIFNSNFNADLSCWNVSSVTSTSVSTTLV